MEKIFLQVEDMIADERFQSWYFNNDKTRSAEWEAWMVSHPGEAPLVNEAKEYMNNLVIKEPVIPVAKILEAEKHLIAAIDAKRDGAPLIIPMQRPVRRWWWAAAAVLVLAVSGTILWNRSQPPALFQTAYGEIREQRLPDGSTIMLNAHSEVSYHPGWEKGVEREVWLKGEAFFHVAKTPSKSRFIVHTDQCDIIVTGTQFNVVNRSDKTSVMLTEGSVILHAKDCAKTPCPDTYMKPGDFIEFSNEKPEKKTAREETVLAWREKKLYFENTPLSVAITKIKEHYGVDIRLDNAAIGDKTITGILPNDNLDVLLQTLEATSEFHVIRDNNEIIITN